MSGPPRGLVVDDNRISRQLLAGHLDVLGYETVLASDGDEAWDILEREGTSFDVVLLDRRMPRMDGMEVLARIKASPHLQTLPVIMQTAADSQQEIIDGIRAGAFYYLTKPVQPEVLLSVTAAAVEHHARFRQLRQGVHRQAAALRQLQTGLFRFKSPRDGSDLATALAAAMPDPQRHVIGLAELMMNAVEHGNLAITYEEKTDLLARRALDTELNTRLNHPDYRDREVTVAFERTPDRVVLTITDEGAGFDWRRYLEMDAKRVFDTHGRGIALAQSISFDTLEYRGRGNQVVATARVPRDSELGPNRDAGAAPLVSGAPASLPTHQGAEDPDRRRLVSVQTHLIHTQADLRASQQRLAADLAAARQMQHDLLPDPAVLDTLQQRHGLRVASHFETSSELGGDLFGLRGIDEHRFALWTVDFAGHGIAAALNTFRLHTMLDEFPEWMNYPGEYLSVLGVRLASLLATEQYATALYGVVDTQSDTLRYAAAASPAPLIANLRTGEVTAGDGSGVPLGIDSGILYETRELAFPPGHLVLLFSDALLECRLGDRTALGESGVRGLLSEAIARHGEGVLLEQVLAPFLDRVDRPLTDDLTALMCVRRPDGTD
ncbi:SpoIIE family protein phosphatase [Roseospira marina]|uniref:SpoIIE family protein phosphatase n=1 Tax=Roseospira marina TaxID=140057 RepID=A0A5M6II40_9PROT|nr:SpoIIE family protein phosphatase [Roseospira marina]KAA5607325.1 SpoIIE family protein phosphatase [Roseospira marina]MBB4312515.1 CheY-like chemotaxis protein [Roseospira marina]MBB5085469.1 CheY-like chemotaxis protein [Roseospira marina]